MKDFIRGNYVSLDYLKPETVAEITRRKDELNIDNTQAVLDGALNDWARNRIRAREGEG